MSASAILRAILVRLGAALRVIVSFAAAILIGAAITWPLLIPHGPERIVYAAALFGAPSLLLAATLATIVHGSNRGRLVALSFVAPFFAAGAYVAFVLAFDFEGLGHGVLWYFSMTGQFPAVVLGMTFASIAAVIVYCWERLRAWRAARRLRRWAGEGGAS